MKLPDEALALLVRQWIAKAEVNYRTAERLVRDDEPIRESIAFHCQQAAEKLIRALLLKHDIEPGLDHHLDVADARDVVQHHLALDQQREIGALLEKPLQRFSMFRAKPAYKIIGIN